MNVIFLDIDGVMNSELLYKENHYKRWFTINHYTWRIKKYFKYIINGFEHKGVSLFDYKTPNKYFKYKNQFKILKDSTCPKKWLWLSELCNETDTKICISSVWKRHFHKKDGWNEDYNNECWEKSLVKLGFKENTFVGITGDRETLRGQEIKNWLDRNPTNKYAIIDDDSDMLPEQMNSFFQTDSYCGLTPNIIYRIKRHFESNPV